MNTCENNEIPASEWLAAMLPLLEAGHELKITPAGVSMTPFLVGGRDSAVLVRADPGALKRRDIVLYPMPDGIYALHRICRARGDKIQAAGDFAECAEPPMDRSEVLAVAKTIIRKGRYISCGGFFYNLLAELWILLMPHRRRILRLHRVVMRIFVRGYTGNKNL